MYALLEADPPYRVILYLRNKVTMYPLLCRLAMKCLHVTNARLDHSHYCIVPLGHISVSAYMYSFHLAHLPMAHLFFASVPF